MLIVMLTPMLRELRNKKKLSFKKISENDDGGTSGTLETCKCDEKVIKESLIKLIILVELSFKFVEHPAFIKFSSDMRPRLNMSFGYKIVRDISRFYLEERKSLFNFSSKESTTVHSTTDMWTSSCKRTNFMVLTAQFMVLTTDTWSSSGRVLDPYRTSLAPNIVEALVCTQDWIRTSSRNITMDTLEDLMKDDELAKEIQEGLDKQKGELTQGKEKSVEA